MPKIQYVPCHHANRSGRGKAARFLPLEVVREMVEAGLAKWDKRARYVNFTKTEAEMPRSQRSCQMGPDVIWGCVLGELRDLACRDAWMGRAA